MSVPFGRVFCLALSFTLLVAANPAVADEVEVATVRFTNLRAPGGDGNWLEADVGLDVKPVPGPVRMVSRVRVVLAIAFELPALAGGGGRRLEHYRAEAECIALEAGRTDVRFYLPPDLVKRDQLHGDPKYWGVELAVSGRSLPGGRTSYSTTLATPEARKNFHTRATAEGAGNDGLLQPQYLTPFAGEYPRATPSFVRRDPH